MTAHVVCTLVSIVEPKIEGGVCTDPGKERHRNEDDVQSAGGRDVLLHFRAIAWRKYSPEKPTQSGDGHLL